MNKKGKVNKLGLAIETSMKGAPQFTTTINFGIIGGVTHIRCFFIPPAGESHIKPTANIVIPNEVFAGMCTQYLTRINKTAQPTKKSSKKLKN